MLPLGDTRVAAAGRLPVALNVAFTLLLTVKVTTHLFSAVTLSHPVHPVSVYPVVGAAVRVILAGMLVADSKSSEQNSWLNCARSLDFDIVDEPAIGHGRVTV